MSRASQRNAWLIQHCYSPYGTTQLQKTGKRVRLAPKGPLWGPKGPRRAQGGQIWSQLCPIGPSGLDSWSPHILTWYRAPSTAQFFCGNFFIGLHSVATFSNMYHLNTRASELQRSASCHFCMMHHDISRCSSTLFVKF